MADPNQQYPPQGPPQGYGQPYQQNQQWNQQPYGQPPQQQWGQPPQQYNQPGQYPPPPQGQYGYQQYPPPQQYGQQGQYPPNVQSPDPRGQYPPPGQIPPPGQAPPGQYPPSQGQYGYQQYPPPQQSYGQPQQGGYPPAPSPYQQGPPQGYPPNQHPPQGYPPNQQPYGVPSTSAAQFPTAAPSPGFTPGQKATGYDPTHDIETIRKACKGFNTDEKALIATLVKLDPLQVESLNQKYTQDTKKQLFELIEDKTRGALEDGLSALAKGPLNFLVTLIYKSTADKIGTNEKFVDMALLGRSNADINAIKKAFFAKYHRTLESIMQEDLSGDVERMYDMILSARKTEESVPVDLQSVAAEAKALHTAGEARAGTDEHTFSRVICKSNEAFLRALAVEYQKLFHISLEQVIKNEFSGHQEDALLYCLHGAVNKAKRDAELIEGTMKGMGTKDQELTYRIIMAKWIPGHINAIKTEYRKLYGMDLIARVRDETSGDHERLLVALLS